MSPNTKAEDKLRESEERFAKAFNSSPLALTITSLETGKLIEVNETFVRTTGYARAEAIGRTTADPRALGELGGPRKRAEQVQETARFAIGISFSRQRRQRNHRTALGGLLEIRGEPCALTVIQDITERKKPRRFPRATACFRSARATLFCSFARRTDSRRKRVAVETYGYEPRRTAAHELAQSACPRRSPRSKSS
jgi:PAS domain S-box-containing protein